MAMYEGHWEVSTAGLLTSLGHLATMWLKETNLTSLNFRFFNYEKMEAVISTSAKQKSSVYNNGHRLIMVSDNDDGPNIF